jgi:hypothetical protein
MDMKFRSLPRTNPSPSHPPSVSRTSPKHKDGTPRPTTVQYMCSHFSCSTIYVRTMRKTTNWNIVGFLNALSTAPTRHPTAGTCLRLPGHHHQTKTARGDSHIAPDAAPSTDQPINVSSGSESNAICSTTSLRTGRRDWTVQGLNVFLNFVPVTGHWGTLPQSVKGAANGTTSTQLYRRL